MSNQELKCLLEHVLQHYEKDVDLVITDIQETSCSNKGDGFMSEGSAAEIVGTKGSGSTYFNNVFIKRPPSKETGSELISVKHFFRNEALLYSEILSHISEGRGNIPKCYYGGEDYIILENLKAQGYGLADKKRGLDLAQSELVMKAIGKFHASTYYWKLLNEDAFSRVTSRILDILTNKETPLPCLESSLIMAINNLTQMHDDTIGPAIGKLESIKGKVADTIRDFEASKMIVLGHRDLWVNNFMFRCQDGVVHEVRIIDFQVILPMSPGPDLWKFLYTSLLPEELNTYCDRLISTYCSVFSSTLRKLGLPSNQIPKEETLKEEIYSRELYGLLVAFWYLPAVYMDQSDNSIIDKVVSESLLNKQRGSNVIDNFTDRIAALVRRCQSRDILL